VLYVQYLQESDLAGCSVAQGSTSDCLQQGTVSLTLVIERLSDSTPHCLHSTGGASFYSYTTIHIICSPPANFQKAAIF